MRHGPFVSALLAMASLASAPVLGRASQGDAIAAALVHAANNPADKARNLLFLDTSGVREKELEVFLKVLNYGCNSLSRHAKFYYPQPIGPHTLVVDIRDYGWRREVIERTLEREPYYHLPVVNAEFKEVKRERIVDHSGGDFLHPDGHTRKNLAPGRYQVEWVEKVKIDNSRPRTVNAPPPEWFTDQQKAEYLTQVAALCQLTGYKLVPIVRADWFFVQSMRQLDRDEKTGAGYYDFLGITKRADILELVGLDEKVSRRIEREIAAVVEDSGVAINSRGILRKGSQAGGIWFTLDVAGNKGDKNPLRVLNGDFVHEAEEIYFTLPNDLFGYGAVNAADGTLQDFVPEKFAGDKASTSNDHRIHPGFSCVRCHASGLQPITDWARQFYDGRDFVLGSPDYEKQKRLESLYLRPLEDAWEADNLVYSKAVFRLSGMTAKEMAGAVRDVWSNYVERKVTANDLAYEWGVDVEDMKAAFRAAAKANGGQIDPIVGAYIKTKDDPKNPGKRIDAEMPMRREKIEEAAPFIAAALKYLPKKP